MITNNTLIARSLRLCGVIGETETPSAEQAAECLGRLNMMLSLWAENDIDLGWFTQSDTTATAPIPEWSEMGVISKLAQVLVGVYPASTLQPWVWDDSQNGYGTIARKSVLEKLEPADMSRLGTGSGRGGFWDITQG